MGTRREARERALELSYEAELRDLPVAEVLEALPAPPDEYATTLVLGVSEHRDEIDALLTKFSQRWAIDRMPAVDRAVLRLGCYELGWQPELSDAVVVNEAVELAKEYSTDDSPRFVNGMLARIAEHLR